jgi:hypothetical protein
MRNARHGSDEALPSTGKHFPLAFLMAAEGDGGEVVWEDDVVGAGNGGDGAIQKIGGGDAFRGKVVAKIVGDEPLAVGIGGAIHAVGVEEDGIARRHGGFGFFAAERGDDSERR